MSIIANWENANVNLVDNTPPIITLIGSSTININQGDNYTDLGATATDNIDGDITADIIINNPVATNTAGVYLVTYGVSDSAGNPAMTATRTVNVIDITNPDVTGLTEEELGELLTKRQYGDFRLSTGISPSPTFVPRQGFKRERIDNTSWIRAAVSLELLLEVFYDLVGLLSMEVDIAVATSHTREDDDQDGFLRENIDRPVFLSTIQDFEDVLLNDGCTGVIAYDEANDLEVQLEEHKLIFIFGTNIDEFTDTLIEHGIYENDNLGFICDGDHIHSTTGRYVARTEELKTSLGVSESQTYGGQ